MISEEQAETLYEEEAYEQDIICSRERTPVAQQVLKKETNRDKRL